MLRIIYHPGLAIFYLFISFIPGRHLLLSAQIECEPVYTYSVLENEFIRSIHQSSGAFWESGGNGYGLTLPHPTNPAYSLPIVASGGLWLGALDIATGQALCSVSYYSSNNDFSPGPLTADGSAVENCDHWDRQWAITQAEIWAFINTWHSGITPEELPSSIRNWPGRNNDVFNLFSLPVDQVLAPFTDINGNGNYEPLLGEFPCIKGDKALWYIYNDVAHHTATENPGLGMQISSLAYLFDTDEAPLNRTIFYELELSRFGGPEIDSIYIGLFAGSNLGNFYDDFIGCSPAAGMGYFYNGDEYDEGAAGFGSEIPALGIQLLHTYPPDAGHLLLDNFLGFRSEASNDGTPTMTGHFYNYLKGKWKDNTPIYYFGSGYLSSANTTHWCYPSLPHDCAPLAWSQCNNYSVCNTPHPAAQQFIMSTGPYSAGSINRFSLHFAILAAYPYSPYPCPDLSALIDAGQEVASLYHEETICNTPTGMHPAPSSGFTPTVFYIPAQHQLKIINPSSHTLPLALWDMEGRQLWQAEVLHGIIHLPPLKSSVYILQYGERTKKIFVY